MSLNGLAALAPPPPDAADDFGFQLVEHGLPDWLARLLRLPLQGRITPDRPRAVLQGPPKPVAPKPRPLRPEYPVGHGPFKCRYCGRYGQPGACMGCGAPNAPASADMPTPPRRPDVIMKAVSTGMLTINEARTHLSMNPIPVFDTVKR